MSRAEIQIQPRPDEPTGEGLDDPSQIQRLPGVVWHLLANLVVLIWAALAGLGLVAREVVGVPHWLPIHLFLLGAVTNAIVTWTEHFAAALLRLPIRSARRPVSWWPVLRLSGLNAGVVAVLVGAVAGPPSIGVVGAIIVVGVVAGHTAELVWRGRRAFGGRFAHVLGWYGWAGGAFIAGGGIGTVMLIGVSSDVRERLELAHLHLQMLGWVGLTVVGTMFTLWPTVLRTRIAAGTERAARRSLRIAVPGLALATVGFLVGAQWVGTAGLVVYTVGFGLASVPLVRAVVDRAPHTTAGWMLAAGIGWFGLALAADIAGLGLPLPAVLVGFVGQVLVGSLTFLLPVVLHGGPAVVRANTARMERFGRVRLVGVNLGLVLVSTGIIVVARVGWVLVLVALVEFLWAAAGTAAGRLRDSSPSVSPGSAPAGGIRRPARPTAPVVGVAIGLILVAAAFGLAVTGDEPPVRVTGTKSVRVTLADSVIRPNRIEVEPGTRLILKVENTGAHPHDLVLATGQRTELLGRGEAEHLEVGPLTEAVDGWCTVPGHRASGMEMRIELTEGPDNRGMAKGDLAPEDGPEGSGESQFGADLDLSAPMSAGWRPYDPVLPPASDVTEHRIEIRASETEREVAPGIRQRVWTFDGTVPGPVLRARVGDRFVITFINDGDLPHGIDFHAGALAPDRPMRTLEPGDRLTYRFTADRAGVWLYHCSTPPMTQHIGNGMYGAVVVDPPDLRPVDREYLLVQGELYLSEPGGPAQVEALREGRPDGWMFNGTAAGYVHRPLTARVGERVRIWVVAAGPSSGTAFHVVGTRFDTVYADGAYLLRPDDPGGAQVLDLAPAQGGFVEMGFPEAGTYPLVDHTMHHAEGGAVGRVVVRGPRR